MEIYPTASSKIHSGPSRKNENTIGGDNLFHLLLNAGVKWK